MTGDTALVIARDITLERSLRVALIESRQRYKDLVEASSDFAWETDSEGRFTFVSPRGAVGYAAGQLVGHRADEVFLDSGGEAASPFATRVPLERVEIWVRTAAAGSACQSSPSPETSSRRPRSVSPRGEAAGSTRTPIMSPSDQPAAS